MPSLSMPSSPIPEPVVLPSPDAVEAAQAALAAATRAHEAGRHEEARCHYLDALAQNRFYPEAEHGLAWLLVQAGDWRGALPRFARAIALRPWEPEFWLSQMEALFMAGCHEAVHQVLARARAAGLAQPHAAAFEQRLAAERIHHLAERVAKTGRPAEAGIQAPEARIRHLCEAYNAQRNEEALRLAREILAEWPLSPVGWRVYGATTRLDREPEEALRALRIAIDLDPAEPDVWINLASALQVVRRVDEAEALLRDALLRHPGHLRTLTNLGVLLASRKSPEAIPVLRSAVALAGDEPRPAIALGCTLCDAGAHDEAIELLEAHLPRAPSSAIGTVALAACHITKGRHAEAAALFGRVDATVLDDLHALGVALFVGSHLDSVPVEAQLRLHRRYGELLEQQVGPAFEAHDNEPDPERPLRVGFVSGDLRDHAVARFVLPLWRRVDRQRFALYGYSMVRNPDAITAEFAALAQGWVEAGPLPDEALFQRIRRDRIDVLVDLSGHTGLNRLPLFARRPAPVQISAIGYPGTTGLSRMDYYLLDTAFLAAGPLDAQFTEGLIASEWGCGFDPGIALPALSPLPCLTGKPFAFGSFNRVGKLNASTLALWARVLQAVPGSVLHLGALGPGDEQHLGAALAAHGVDPARLHFIPRLELPGYLAMHARVDLLLDTVPYGGGTTSVYGALMGVPTLSLAGPSLASRCGLSLLGRVGLAADFVVGDEAAFIDRAAFWAAQPERLAELRAGLRERLAGTALGDPDLAAAGFEDAVRAAWRRWCRREPPAAMTIPRRLPDRRPSA